MVFEQRAGGTSTNYFIVSSATSSADASTYQVVVTNVAGSATSSVATLSVSTQPFAFNPLRLVVVRSGDGAQVQTANGNSLYFDQFTTGGTYLNTVAIPDTGNSALLIQGISTTEGYISLSPDNLQLCMAGYQTNLSYGATVAGATSATIPRGVMTMDGVAHYTLAAKTFVAFSATSPRSAMTDGTNNFWGTGGNSGVFYFGTNAFALNGTNAPATNESATVNLRVGKLVNGLIYFTTGSASGNAGVGLYRLTNSYPKLPGLNQTAVALTGAAVSPHDFAVKPDLSIIYICDDGAVNGNTGGGIERWDLVSGSYTRSYTLGPAMAPSARTASRWIGAARTRCSTRPPRKPPTTA